MKSYVHWFLGAGALAAGSVAIARGASANAPGDPLEDGGRPPLYEAGSDYGTDSGEGDEAGQSCADTQSVDNCGACGNVCPGIDASTDNIRCSAGDAGTYACGFTCLGENYDVNADAGDGCEKKDAPLGNHSPETAVSQGSFSCTDGDSQQNITGTLLSDQRVHEDPSVAGFSIPTGSATDYFSIGANGGTFCQNDLKLHLQVSGSKTPACYTLTAVRDKGTDTCTADASGACDISNGSGSYSGGSTIVVSLTKTCSNATHEDASYVITGHL